MVSVQTLVCEKREILDKGHRKLLKRSGLVPGILYGKGKEPIPILLAEKQFAKTLKVHGHRGLFALQLGEEPKPFMVLIREIQKNPINGRLNHVDFLMVDMDQKINSTVGIILTGEDKVIERGAVLQTGAKEVVINCLPGNIPDYFYCDVSELEIGDKKTIGDLQVPEEVEVVSDPDTLVASVIAPTVPDIEEPDQEGDEENQSPEE
ncbi:MAG: 50S ribosomal protein L25 [Syntrophomonadaceae bacterium]|nr:50S ribosomal protein L25 [Syntrophomonadaceae bacterium]